MNNDNFKYPNSAFDSAPKSHMTSFFSEITSRGLSLGMPGVCLDLLKRTPNKNGMDEQLATAASTDN